MITNPSVRDEFALIHVIGCAKFQEMSNLPQIDHRSPIRTVTKRRMTAISCGTKELRIQHTTALNRIGKMQYPKRHTLWKNDLFQTMIKKQNMLDKDGDFYT